MKNNILSLIIGIVIGFLILRNCSKIEKKIITIPEKKGQFYNNKIVHETITSIKEVTKYLNNKIVETELKLKILENNNNLKKYKNEIDTILKDYMNADSLLKVEKFKNQISLKKFENINEDDDVIIRTTGIVSGEVKEIDTYYTIKKQHILISEKNKSFNFGIGSDFNATTPVVKIGVGYKNYKLDYYKINNQNLGTISYEIKF